MFQNVNMLASRRSAQWAEPREAASARIHLTLLDASFLSVSCSTSTVLSHSWSGNWSPEPGPPSSHAQTRHIGSLELRVNDLSSKHCVTTGVSVRKVVILLQSAEAKTLCLLKTYFNFKIQGNQGPCHWHSTPNWQVDVGCQPSTLWWEEASVLPYSILFGRTTASTTCLATCLPLWFHFGVKHYRFKILKYCIYLLISGTRSVKTIPSGMTIHDPYISRSITLLQIHILG